jgi:hypothetical protein
VDFRMEFVHQIIPTMGVIGSGFWICRILKYVAGTRPQIRSYTQI